MPQLEIFFQCLKKIQFKSVYLKVTNKIILIPLTLKYWWTILGVDFTDVLSVPIIYSQHKTINYTYKYLFVSLVLFKENYFSSATPRHCAESKQVFANRRRWISCQLYWPLRYTFKSTCVFHVGGQIRWDYLAIKMFKCYRNVSWRPKPLHSGLKLILKNNSCFHVYIWFLEDEDIFFSTFY